MVYSKLVNRTKIWTISQTKKICRSQIISFSPQAILPPGKPQCMLYFHVLEYVKVPSSVARTWTTMSNSNINVTGLAGFWTSSFIYLLVLFLFPVIGIKSSSLFIIAVALATLSQETQDKTVFCVVLNSFSLIKKEKLSKPFNWLFLCAKPSCVPLGPGLSHSLS